MIKSNPTILKLYLFMMDSFSEYLSHKYTEVSLETPNRYKTIIIQKVVRMFHSLEKLVKETQDEVSARCVLRGILDSVAVYCFIYQREDRNEILFRHYLYVLDGISSYRDGCLGCILDIENVEKFCCSVIKRTRELINNHPYLKDKTKTIDTIIEKNNWKYKSLTDSSKLKYEEIYRSIGFDDKSSKYYQSYLSQFAHGLCISNIPDIDSEQLQNVLLESIPLADKMIQGIYKTFQDDDLTSVLLNSEVYMNKLYSSNYNHKDLLDFLKAILRKDRTLLV